MVNWTAVKTFSFEFFRSIYAADSPVFQARDQQCQFFPYRTNFHNLSEVFQMSEDRAHMKSGSEPWYIGW
jgi:histone arginine demethylase JMJD6